MALQHFAEQKCDLVIWETGLGGRLDSTNIVTPLISVITNIQYDHQKWLGETLASIAAEKAALSGGRSDHYRRRGAGAASGDYRNSPPPKGAAHSPLRRRS